MIKLSFVSRRFYHYQQEMNSKLINVTKCVYVCQIIDGGYKEELFRVTGITYHDPNDKYDKQLGERIADTKAKIKAYAKAKTLFRSCEKSRRAYVKELHDILDFKHKMIYLQKSENKHLRDLHKDI